MLIHHTAEEWPEAVGKTVHCAGCSVEYQSFECLSITMNNEANGIIQVRMFLICIKCVTEKATPIGRC